jgi:hypothetical protein
MTIYHLLNTTYGGLSGEDDLAAVEILHELILGGVIVFGNNLQDPNRAFIHVTPLGQQCLAETRLLAYDPDGYLRRGDAAWRM